MYRAAQYVRGFKIVQQDVTTQKMIRVEYNNWTGHRFHFPSLYYSQIFWTYQKAKEHDYPSSW